MESAGYYLIVIAVAVYYFFAWLVLGRKPRQESVVVRYEPPAAASPAVARYVFTQSCDGRTFAAVVAQLAARRIISVTPSSKTVHVTQLQKERRVLEQLSDEERLVLKNLFEWNDSGVDLATPDSRFMEKLQECLQIKAAEYVTRNLIYVVIALVASAVATTWMCLSLHLFGNDLFEEYLLAAFTGLTVGMFIAASVYLWDRNSLAIVLAFRGVYRRRVIPVLLFFVFLFPAMWYVLMRTITPSFAGVTVLLMIVNMLAAPALRGYTAAGKQLFGEILGFRQFLQQVEQDRLQRLNAPGKPLQTGQQYLPYAIALDVREDWGDELGIKAMVETAL